VPEAAMFLAGLAAEEAAGFGRSSGITDLETILRIQGREALSYALATMNLPPVHRATDDVEGALAALADAFPTKKDPFGRLMRVYSFVLAFLRTAEHLRLRIADELLTGAKLTARDLEGIVGTHLPVRRKPR
jgi:hypothetical protein